MKRTSDRTKIYKTDHTQFGGCVYASDFNTDYRGKDTNYNGSTIASRIARDQKFDNQCRKNIENRQNYGGNKNA